MGPFIMISREYYRAVRNGVTYAIQLGAYGWNLLEIPADENEKWKSLCIVPLLEEAFYALDAVKTAN